LIGLGAIGGAVAEAWAEQSLPEDRLCAILARPGQLGRATDPATLVTACADAFLDHRLDVVIEAAGHAAVAEHGEQVLARGCDLHVLSVGALADDALRARLAAAAARGGSRVVVPAGALAGFDGLASLRLAGLESVTYTSVKPVAAWRGTAADTDGRLDGLSAADVIFEGSARAAARAFPRNANLAAAVALAGAGFDETYVVLIADPSATANTGRIRAVSKLGRLELSLASDAFDGNPKSSRITAMSAIAALRSSGGWLGFA